MTSVSLVDWKMQPCCTRSWRSDRALVRLPLCAMARPPNEKSANSGRTLRSIGRSEEHTSELQSLMRSSYAVFCLNKKRAPNTKYEQPPHYKTTPRTQTHSIITLIPKSNKV